MTEVDRGARAATETVQTLRNGRRPFFDEVWRDFLLVHLERCELAACKGGEECDHSDPCEQHLREETDLVDEDA